MVICIILPSMNFLAHLHLAALADSSLLGNLLADFVRGNPQGEYPPEIVAGIMMHRRVDVMTDTLPLVKEARTYFSADYRRVSPITLDVLWDHFLARHWDQLVPNCTLPDFFSMHRAKFCHICHIRPLVSKALMLICGQSVGSNAMLNSPSLLMYYKVWRIGGPN